MERCGSWSRLYAAAACSLANPRAAVAKPQAADSMLPAATLLRRQNLQTSRPPAGEDRCHEFLRQALRTHLGGQPFMIVHDRHELDTQLRIRRQQRVPNIRAAVV